MANGAGGVGSGVGYQPANRQPVDDDLDAGTGSSKGCSFSDVAIYTGAGGAFAGTALAVAILSFLLFALISNAVCLTTGFSPSGLATAFEITQWAAVAAGGGVVLAVAGGIIRNYC